MTEEEEKMVVMGDHAENFLQSDSFSSTINSLVDQCFQAFAFSKPEDEKQRTSAYYQYQAINEIVNTIKQRVAVRDEINNRASDSRSDEE